MRTVCAVQFGGRDIWSREIRGAGAQHSWSCKRLFVAGGLRLYSSHVVPSPRIDTLHARIVLSHDEMAVPKTVHVHVPKCTAHPGRSQLRCRVKGSEGRFRCQRAHVDPGDPSEIVLTVTAIRGPSRHRWTPYVNWLLLRREVNVDEARQQ